MIIRPRAYIDEAILAQIMVWCRASKNLEIGGLLGGFGRHVMMALQMENVSEIPATEYSYTIASARRIARSLRDRGLHKIGGWHSHPPNDHSDAAPTVEDFDNHKGLEIIVCGNEVRAWSFMGDDPLTRLQQEYRLYTTREIC